MRKSDSVGCSHARHFEYRCVSSSLGTHVEQGPRCLQGRTKYLEFLSWHSGHTLGRLAAEPTLATSLLRDASLLERDMFSDGSGTEAVLCAGMGG